MRITVITLLSAVASICTFGIAGEEIRPAGAKSLESFARLALDCVHREYPNKIAHVLDSDADALPPRKLTPAFYGCFDWHSSVHGHWLLARVARAEPEGEHRQTIADALLKSITAANVDTETAYILREGRESFERPYGLAWLLQLAMELREWEQPPGPQLARTIRPLERAAIERISEWLPKLAYPIRTGEHSQTAFAFGLILDYARSGGDTELEELLVATTRRLYDADAGCPLGWEPSGQDFLSPCLAEADLMRRVMSSAEYAAWLGAFLPQIPRSATAGWLPLGVVTDRSDGKLAHLDGLNLSRAWMLEGIASGLPAGDPRRPALEAAARAHAESALQAVSAEHYAGGHWLGSFATYLVTRRGIEQARE